MTYSHRNGESELPTIEGYYWRRNEPYSRHTPIVQVFRDLDSSRGEEARLFMLALGMVSEIELSAYGDEMQWWGPVTPPWEKT